MNSILDKIYEEQIKICKSIVQEQNIKTSELNTKYINNIGITIGKSNAGNQAKQNNNFYSLTGCISYKKKNS